MYNKVKSFIVPYWFFYLIGFFIILGLKCFYRDADSNDLAWILTPTARWVGILSGIPFEYEPGIGYINHSFRFIIAPSCSGVQFMCISIATLIYSFVHRMKTKKKGFCWIAISLVLSYLFTVFINGFRIVISIYLPIYLRSSDMFNKWLTPERLHTMIGTAVYFTSLLILYRIAGYICRKITDIPDRNTHGMPVFWYFFIVLGIPFLRKAYKNDNGRFAEYAILITGICLTILFAACLMAMIRKHWKKSSKLTRSIRIYGTKM